MLLQTKAKTKKTSEFFSNPARVIVTSFAGLVLIGTLLLMLPISSRSGESFPFLSALFTATSASCVTGLIVVDTYTHFTLFGQFVILSLIQLGGLGLVTYATFFNIAIKKRIGLKSLYVAQESVNSNSFYDIRFLLRIIFTVTFVMEAVGALILAMVFVPKYGAEGIFISIFLAVSAYCNAGFDILGFEGKFTSLTNYFDNPIVLITIMALIICGGLGFIVWQDIMQLRKGKRLGLHTRLVIIGSAILIIGGALMFLAFEWSNTHTIGDMSFGNKLLNSFFASVSSRTAGFNTVDVGNMFGITKFMTIILMFVGAAPGGTGGGIKLTTMYVLIMTVVCVMRGKDETTISKHKLDKSVIYKAMAVLSIAFLVVMIAAGTIFFTSHANVGRFDEVDALFEATSAFGTVGLSSGVTAAANQASIFILTLTMFVGRVGPASLALSLALRPQDKTSVLPDAKIMVG